MPCDSGRGRPHGAHALAGQIPLPLVWIEPNRVPQDFGGAPLDRHHGALLLGWLGRRSR